MAQRRAPHHDAADMSRAFALGWQKWRYHGPEMGNADDIGYTNGPTLRVGPLAKLERETGFEPATSTLAN